MKQQKGFGNVANTTFRVLIVICTVVILLGVTALYFYGVGDEPQEKVISVNQELIENGIHLRTGLVVAEGMQTVITNCTTCHSSKLIVQNRMGAEQWNATIRWMQKTQGLWELGENQKIIVDYLVENYPPLEKGRRETLTHIDWYELD